MKRLNRFINELVLAALLAEIVPGTLGYFGYIGLWAGVLISGFFILILCILAMGKVILTPQTPRWQDFFLLYHRVNAIILAVAVVGAVVLSAVAASGNAFSRLVDGEIRTAVAQARQTAISDIYAIPVSKDVEGRIRARSDIATYSAIMDNTVIPPAVIGRPSLTSLTLQAVPTANWTNSVADRFKNNTYMVALTVLVISSVVSLGMLVAGRLANVVAAEDKAGNIGGSQ